MLLILVFKVAKLPIEFIESVLQVLNNLVSFLNFLLSPTDGFLLRVQQIGDAVSSLLVVFRLLGQDLKPLVLGFKIFLAIIHDIPHLRQLLRIPLVDILLLTDKLLIVVDVLLDIHILGVLLRALLPDLSQLPTRIKHLPLSGAYLFE